MSIFEGIHSIAVYNPLDGVAVEITPIEFQFDQDDFDTGEKGPTGNHLYQGERSMCSFSFLDPLGTITPQLLQWKRDRTRVSMVALGTSVAIFWRERDTFTLSPAGVGQRVRKRGDRWDFEMIRAGHGTHDIGRHVNLLAPAGWGDADSDGVADGYFAFSPGTGLSTFTFSGGEQTIEANELSGIFRDIILPFTKTPLRFTLSINILTLHTADSSYVCRAQWLNINGTLLSETVIDDTETGIKSVQISGNEGLVAPFKLRIWPLVMPAADFGSMVGKDPNLRLDRSDVYSLA